MNKRDILTHQQFQINLRSDCQTQHTNRWLAEQGLDADTFGTTHIRLLQAQQQAHTLLTHHSRLLKDSQRMTLERFQQQMRRPKTRSRLKPTAANAVLNISTRINRQLFKQHRQLTQA
jgi:hypothetical protein